MTKRTGTFPLYKGTGAAQFSLIPARHTDKGFLDKAGSVLVEAAPSAGKQKWDWDQKISFAISIQDVANLIDSDSSKNRLFHDNAGTPKTLEFKPGEAGTRYEGTYMMTLSEGKGGDRRSVSVPFSNGEYSVLLRLLVGACPKMIAWE